MKTYIRAKLRILRQLGIEISDTERELLQSGKTEIAVDNIARSLILNFWKD